MEAHTSHKAVSNTLGVINLAQHAHMNDCTSDLGRQCQGVRREN